MMNNIIISILLLTAMLIISSCTCSGEDCQENGSFVTLQVFVNNENFLFEENIPIENIDIVLTNQRTNMISVTLLNSVVNGVQLFLRSDDEYLLEIEGLEPALLRLQTRIIDNSGCCETLVSDNISYNGEEICTEECETVRIDI